MRTIVTGAARGIGRAVCRRLARDARRSNRPAHIAAVDRAHEDELETLLAELREEGAEATPFMGDLGDPDAPARIVAEAADAMGGIDALVSNAGISSPAPLTGLEVDSWDRVMHVNARATWLLGKAAHPHLKESRGAIAVTASMSGMNAHSGMGAYSASKAAVIILARQMAQEWAADGIRVNCVSPGLVRTSMTAAMYEDPEIRAGREALVPMGRVADPAEDIAGIIAFLLGPDSRYVTGQVILADGGLSDSIYTHIPGRPRS